ncbi:8825_t:CDS:10 [Paraglomus brasilianum]|uniref:8825_t:CDS:1 n=1 Tax=Paraglomus brasilianum TaxID=144538 RepID=A0A9N9G5G2_9GLOM|nr:8825_t:CDS:10 [Paraglomus brasilianum]
MSTKQRPAVPPKPARLSMGARKLTSPITTPRSLTEQPLFESPPSSPSPKTPSTGESTPVGTVSFSVPVGRQARALYDFEGEPEFRELSFFAGDVLNVLREQLAEGWSMAEKDGITGLVPDSYITYINEFNEVPPSTLAAMRYQVGGISHAQSQVHMNGSIRYNSIIGRRQLNRFSWFVTTGVEEYLLDDGNGQEIPQAKTSNDEEIEEVSESDKHYVQSGPSWLEKAPIFKVLVHSPERRVKLGGMSEYTIFHVTSLFPGGIQVSVERRFSQFEWLYNMLCAKFGALVLPPLPEKQFAGRFNDDFIQRRRRALERFINRLARHPVIRYSDLLTHFLSCQSDSEWRRREKEFEQDKILGYKFFQHVYHPEFNVDDGDLETVEKFEAFARSMEKLMPWVNEASQAHKDSMTECQRQYRRVSYSLLRLITGHNVGDGFAGNNEDGAWCWRDGCQACLNLTKAVQSVSESLQSVADLYESYINDNCVPLCENLRDYSNPMSTCLPIIDMHMGTYKRYKDIADASDPMAEDENVDLETISSRCDTVFNVTLAEIDRIHDERVWDFKENTKQYLDGQIEFYEKILEELRQARATFDDPHYSSLSQTPRETSKYEAMIDSQRPVLARPVSMASVSSMTTMMGGVVDGVGSMGSFLKRTARSSIAKTTMFEGWWGRS